ncbi:MAG: hypothetical protein QXS20_10840 [Candidatus Thorarchaeota archaeon]
MMSRILNEKVDVLIIDDDLLVTGTTNTLSGVENLCPGLPVIILTSDKPLRGAVGALDKGVYSFVPKSDDLGEFLVRTRAVVLKEIANIERTNFEESLNLALDLMQHDIRNYLQAIQLAAEILTSTDDETDKARFGSIVFDSVAAAESLIRDVVALSLGPGVKKYWHLNEEIQEALKIISSARPDLVVEASLGEGEYRVLSRGPPRNLFINLVGLMGRDTTTVPSKMKLELSEHGMGYRVSIDLDTIPSRSQDRVSQGRSMTDGGGPLDRVRFLVRQLGGTMSLSSSNVCGKIRTSIVMWIPRSDKNC